MGAPKKLFLSHILTALVGLSIAQNNFVKHFCIDSGNFTTNSAYRENLNTLLSSLSSNINSYSFYNSSVGQNSDKVSVIALCRGDVELQPCRSCINDSTSKLTELCPNNKEAIGWYDNCMLRYSNKSIFGTFSDSPEFELHNQANVSNLDEFSKKLSSLFDSLREKAARGGSQRKFAVGNATGLGFDNIYALVQCTPDLSEQQCRDCLSGASQLIPICCNGKIGARVVRPSCIVHYETRTFFKDTPADTTSPPAPPGNDDNTGRTVIIIVVPTVSLIIITICVFIIFRKRKLKKPPQDIEIVEEISNVESLQYHLDTIQVATDDFSDANKLGQGGFGAVYKGRLPNGQKIAVKRLSKDSGQGELEFENEVMLVAKLQHRNLVRLLGFCLEGMERLLIYEFVPNSSLDYFIFDHVKRAHLDWEKRYKIIEGIARGLLYLHEDSRLRIIHRDLKASNILLDEEMNPKISDFGMARLFMLDETHGSTSRIVGTYGYMAPEYAMHGQFSVKSDVFSFGVLVLEIMSGQKNNCFQNGENVEDLLSYAWKNWGRGTALDLIDPILKVASSGSMRQMMRYIHIGLLCVQENIANRPTMASVDLMLNSFSITLPVPSEPAFFMHSSIESELPLLQNYDSSQCKSKSTSISKNEVLVTELYPR